MKTILLLLFCQLAVSVVFAQRHRQHASPVANLPAWVLNTPVSETHYNGVGKASKTNNPTDYKDVAYAAALSAIAQQIVVQLSGNTNLHHTVTETNTAYSQEDVLTNNILSKFKNKLEDLNKTAEWQNETEYYVWVQLDKAAYHAIRQAAWNSCQGFVNQQQSKAQTNYAAGQMPPAFMSLKHALQQLQPWTDELVETEYCTPAKQLKAKVLEQYYEMLTNVKFSNTTTPQFLDLQNQNRQFSLTAYVLSPQADTIFCKNLPLIINTHTGEPQKRISVQTNAVGAASVPLSHLHIGQSGIDIQVFMDTTGLLPAASIAPPRNFVLPKAQFHFTPPKLKIAVINNAGSKKERAAGQNAIAGVSNWLTQNGCLIQADTALADYVVTLETENIAENYLDGYYMAKLLVHLQIRRNKETAYLVNKPIIVKGVHLSKAEALATAYRNIGPQLTKTEIPNFIQTLFN